jgi:UDP-N-acetylglucosamine diphosphorylase/glucosamine-1-phosphate N-acetyltransferase
MKLCVFEDSAVAFLEPVALTRPAFDLRCGAGTLLDRQRRFFGDGETGAWLRPELVNFARLAHRDMPLNDGDWVRRGPTVLVNARWLAPDDQLSDVATPRVGIVGSQVAYVISPAFEWADLEDGVDVVLAKCQATLPSVAAGGVMLDFLWDFVDRTGEAIADDAEWFRHSRSQRATLPENVTVMGPSEGFLVADDAEIEPYVTADTRNGPVIVDRGAIVHSFSRLEGPCYIGPQTWIMGAKIRAGSTLGPWCRIGGEVECSVVQGYTNKYHEGFLGHSYLGEWVNLAAATQTSDLRNDYGTVRLTVNGHRINTGRAKVGSYIGDHTKSGLSALLNTGSVIGAFCNILPSGSLLPQIVPSYCQVQYGHVAERWDLKQMFATAGTVMGRRNLEFTDAHREFFDLLYETTADRRRRTIREYEVRRMKRQGS